MQRISQYDGVRAFAVIAVFLFHAGPQSPLQGGFLGVDVFFVLSGYLITGILMAEHERSGRLRILRFYWRRFWRLMPPFAYLLIIYALAAPLIWNNFTVQEHGFQALVAGLYLADYGYAFWDVPFYLRHSWSLAVEEHFYLIWPPVLLLVLRSKRASLWLGLLYLSTVAWRAINFAVLDWQIVYYRFDTRFAGIVLGAWLAAWMLDNRPAKWRLSPAANAALAFLAAALLLCTALLAEWRNEHSIQLLMPACEIATAALICAIARAQSFEVDSQGRVLRLLAWRPLVRIGVLSYGIYLWHFPIILVTRRIMDLLPSLIVSGALSVAMALLSYHTVEKMGRSMRRKQDAEDRNRPESGIATAS